MSIIIFIFQYFNPGQFFSAQETEGCSATGRNKCHFISHAHIINYFCGRASSHNGSRLEGSEAPYQRPGAFCESRYFIDSHRTVPEYRFTSFKYSIKLFYSLRAYVHNLFIMRNTVYGHCFGKRT